MKIKLIPFLFGQKKQNLKEPEENFPELPENIESHLTELYKKTDYELLSEHSMLRVINKNCTKKLLELNDNAEEEREVFHRIYFRSNTSKRKFLKITTKYGFRLIDEIRERRNEYSFYIKIMRVDKTDIKSVNKYTFFLYKLALDNHGAYDCWETHPK